MDPTSRDALLDAQAAAAAQGDRAAFETLCRELDGDVWRYCHTLLSDRELAFEAAQDTFVRLVSAIGRWRGDAPVRLYVLVIARRATARLLEREVRRRDRTADGVTPDRRLPDPTGEVDLTDLVAGLEPDRREAFVLTQLVGLSYEEAATAAGCAVGTIRSRVFRARAQLVEALREETDDVR